MKELGTVGRTLQEHLEDTVWFLLLVLQRSLKTIYQGTWVLGKNIILTLTLS